MCICLDYGHGGKDLGATFGDRKESVEVLLFGQKLAYALRKQGIRVIETRVKDMYVGLDERVRLANQANCDYFISLHRNSSVKVGPKGAEVFIAKQSSKRSLSLARCVQKNLVGMGFLDRGVKREDFYVLRNTRMPAILVELGFINNQIDNNLFDTLQEELVESLARTIAQRFITE